MNFHEIWRAAFPVPSLNEIKQTNSEITKRTDRWKDERTDGKTNGRTDRHCNFNIPFPTTLAGDNNGKANQKCISINRDKNLPSGDFSVLPNYT